MAQCRCLLVGFFICAACLLRGEVINQSVVNVYIQPQEDTEVDSQAIYGNGVVVIEENGNGWSRIRMPDGVEGWVKSSQVVRNDSFEQSSSLRPLKNLFAHIYRVTDTSPYPPLLTIPYGAKIKLVETIDRGERWVPIELVTGEEAWIQRGDVDFAPKRKTLEEILTFSKKFIALPYTWGGTSSYGFDCSGFVQMLFKEMGLLLPRNSRDQANSPLLIPVSRDDLLAGDLIFFGESRITHVGLYLGDDAVIYSGVRGATPTVMIDYLQSTKYVYNTARRIAQRVSAK